jgi:hypothetical protein
LIIGRTEIALKPWYKVVTPREDLREGKPLVKGDTLYFCSFGAKCGGRGRDGGGRISDVPFFKR